MTKKSQKKRIIVHLGLRKTATTAIQHLLMTHNDMLPPDLKVLSRDKRFEQWRTHVYRYMTAPPDQADVYKKSMLEGIEDEIKKQAKWLKTCSEDTILITDENLFAARVYVHNETIFDWAGAVLPMLEKHWTDFDLTFLLYIRDEARWLRSCHNQEVKNNRLGLHFMEWTKGIPEAFDLAKNAQDLAKHLKNPMHIINMETEAASEHGIGYAVFSAAGLSDADIARLPPPERLNQSLPPAALELMIAVNRLDIPDASKPAIGNLTSKLRHLFTN